MSNTLLIGNQADRNAYEYSDDDFRKLFRALMKEIEAAKPRLTGDSDFRLE